MPIIVSVSATNDIDDRDLRVFEDWLADVLATYDNAPVEMS